MALTPRADDPNRKDELKKKSDNLGSWNHLEPAEKAALEHKSVVDDKKKSSR